MPATIEQAQYEPCHLSHVRPPSLFRVRHRQATPVADPNGGGHGDFATWRSAARRSSRRSGRRAGQGRLAALVDAGMDAARLNFSHASHEQHRAWAEMIRAVGRQRRPAARPRRRPPGPEAPHRRSACAAAPRDRGGSSCRPERSARDGELPISPAVIGEVLTAGNDVLIDDGLVRLRVEEVEHGRARCRVLIGGVVSSHKGVNLPGVPLPIPSLTAKDVSDLELALELEVDYVALSFVRSAADVRELRELIERVGLACGGDREDREGRGGRRARRHPRGDRRDHGRPRRPRRRDRPGLGAAAPEADHPALARAREAGDHGHADARVDDRARRADAGRGERRRERGARRLVRADALRRDRGRHVPDRDARLHGPDHQGGRAEPRLSPPDARPGRGADSRSRDVERSLRPRRGARRAGDPRPDGDRANGVRGRPPAAAPPDRRR